jgi:hypothetical protein
MDIDAAVVRNLGKNAAALYHALRRLADGRSGELRIRGQWLKAIRFDREAKMCERVRLSAMRELVTAGLVTFTRPRVRRMIGGRLRAVAGSVHYVVHRQPVPPENRQKIRDSSKLHLQNCISGSLLEMQSQIVSNPPIGGAGSISVLPFSENHSAMDDYRHHQHPKPEDDENVSTKEFSSSNPKVQTSEKLPIEEKTTPAIPPELGSWLDTRILARAKSPVKNRGAFLRKSRPEFIENMDDEVEVYLQERAEKFMAQRIEEKGAVCYGQVYDFLQAETEAHALPVGLWIEDGQESEEFSVTREDPSSVYGRIYENAAEVLGLEKGDDATK